MTDDHVQQLENVILVLCVGKFQNWKKSGTDRAISK
jgi:hypothetical protein